MINLLILLKIVVNEFPGVDFINQLVSVLPVTWSVFGFDLCHLIRRMYVCGGGGLHPSIHPSIPCPGSWSRLHLGCLVDRIFCHCHFYELMTD